MTDKESAWQLSVLVLLLGFYDEKLSVLHRVICLILLSPSNGLSNDVLAWNLQEALILVLSG